MLKKAYNQLYESNDHLLFGWRKANVHLPSLHPQQVQLFRLWQIYLENVDPLLQITHAPTLQSRIIDAAGDVASISPTLEALMFSIYCVSVLSLAEDRCRDLFGLPRKDLLASYQFGCQQALLNCEVLRSSDRDCLTALYLYLVSLPDCHLAYLPLTRLDLCQTRYGSPIPIFDARSSHPHRSAHGHSQRVCPCQMQHSRS